MIQKCDLKITYECYQPLLRSRMYVIQTNNSFRVAFTAIELFISSMNSDNYDGICEIRKTEFLVSKFLQNITKIIHRGK